MLPPLPLRIPAALSEQAVDIGQRAVAIDEEPETFAVRLTGPLAVPRLAARVVRLEAEAPECLPAAMRASLNVAPVLVLLADGHAAVGTVFHRARTYHLSPRPRFAKAKPKTRDSLFETATSRIQVQLNAANGTKLGAGGLNEPNPRTVWRPSLWWRTLRISSSSLAMFAAMRVPPSRVSRLMFARRVGASSS
jgi:hypothetical protein